MDAQVNSLMPSLNYRKLKHIHPKYGRKRGTEVEESFKCKHCQAYVHTTPILSGVQNRNHCPYCLRSRHLDLYQAGDRLSACKAMMQPIGLTVKITRNKYGRKQIGELMLIHRCSECSKVSINRIATDDNNSELESVLRNSSEINSSMRVELENMGIHLLQSKEAHIVTEQLFGTIKLKQQGLAQ